MKPTVISLFSGVGGFDLGLERAGFQVVAQAENDPFCNKVLAKHWPEVLRYGDVRDIQRESVQHVAGVDLRQQSMGTAARGGVSVDLICGGFPCQDLSVAGKRAGLDGARSGLWFEFHRILSELRPAFCLIENVPGLLSSNQGRDFGIVLSGLGELWPAVGWAVLDSQHFGVPQRRRRLYVIAGPPRERIAQILSLCEGGDWHPQTSRATGQDVASTIRGRSSSPGVNEPGRGGEDDVNLVVGTLNTHDGDKWGSNQWVNENKMVLAHSLRAQAQLAHRADVDTLITHSLRAEGFDASEDGTGRGTPLTVIQDARGVRNKAQNGIGITENADVMYTLDGTSQHAFQQSASVRRLTPVECERLQGFPDDWTKVDNKTADGPRYKACGNAVTVPVIEYIGRRLMTALVAGQRVGQESPA